MKETVNVSIASQAFILDEDAWLLVKEYLGSIRDRIDPDDTETLADIEARIADLFRERLTSPMMVVSSAMARRVMEQIGSPEVFGEPRTPHEEGDSSYSSSASFEAAGQWGRPLRRSRTDRVLAGVCGGIAQYFDCDAALIRLITLMLVILGGLSFWVYVILWIVIPEEQKKFHYHERRQY